jgi:hypothetical protein
MQKLEKVAEGISDEKGKEGTLNCERTRIRLIVERKKREEKSEREL